MVVLQSKHFVRLRHREATAHEEIVPWRELLKLKRSLELPLLKHT